MAKDAPFKFAEPQEIARRKQGKRHLYGPRPDAKAICVTEELAPDNLLEIVVGTADGIPLWAKGCTLRWRFDKVSITAFEDPEKGKDGVRALLKAALDDWGDAAPVAFVEDETRFDFEIVIRTEPRCSTNGCVLASAFFPDGGQHKLTIYPTLFDQDPQEQKETLIHEIGHTFGLRHFFAKDREGQVPSVIFGEHVKFSIMNYGSNSKLTDADRNDLKLLYEKAWDKSLTEIGDMKIKLVRPFSDGGTPG